MATRVSSASLAKDILQERDRPAEKVRSPADSGFRSRADAGGPAAGGDRTTHNQCYCPMTGNVRPKSVGRALLPASAATMRSPPSAGPNDVRSYYPHTIARSARAVLRSSFGKSTAGLTSESTSAASNVTRQRSTTQRSFGGSRCRMRCNLASAQSSERRRIRAPAPWSRFRSVSRPGSRSSWKWLSRRALPTRSGSAVHRPLSRRGVSHQIAGDVSDRCPPNFAG